jgi:hyperosmotically inducible protein
MTNHDFLLPIAIVAVVAACTRADDRTAHAAESPTITASNMDGKETAMSQSNAQADLDHLADIRKALVADDALSIAAKNVHILTKDGHVTLRGKVSTSLERESIEAHVRSCPATRSIDDLIALDTP